MKVCCW